MVEEIERKRLKLRVNSKENIEVPCFEHVVSKPSPKTLISHSKSYSSIMEEVKTGLRYVFKTQNSWTIPMPGPCQLGMEAVISNLVQPGDSFLIFVSGVCGQRACETALRNGAKLIKIEKEAGETFTLDEIEKELHEYKPKVLYLVHQDMAGAVQKLKGVGQLCRENDCLFAVDGVETVGEIPVYVDAWEIDAIFCDSQKGLRGPQGLSPVSFSQRAEAVVRNRHCPVRTFKCDMILCSGYWNCNKSKNNSHHTGPPQTLVIDLWEALENLHNETIEVRWEEVNGIRAGMRESSSPIPQRKRKTTDLLANSNNRQNSLVGFAHILHFTSHFFKVEFSGGEKSKVENEVRVGTNPEKILPVKKPVQRYDKFLRIPNYN